MTKAFKSNITAGNVDISGVLTTYNGIKGQISGIEVLAFGNDANGSIEIGKSNGSTSTPFIDFHSGATVVDYDVRLLASGGTGTSGGGTLTIGAASLTTSGTFAATSTISASGLAGSLLTSTVGTALGTAAAGTATVPARSDHVHPTTGLVLTAGGSTITGSTGGVKGLVIKPATTGLTATITAASLTSSATGLSGSITASLATTTITGITSTAGLSVGMKLTKVTGTGVFGGTAGTTVITSIDSATQITIFSTAANTAGTLTSFSAAPPTNGVTYTASNTFSVGQMVSVTGITPSSLNPTYTYVEVIGASSTTFTVIATGLSGTYTSGGTASAWSNAQEFQTPSGTLATKVNALGGLYTGGQVDESSLNYGIHAGTLAGTPRLLFVPQSVTDASTNWQIDVYAGTFRWFTPGVVQMSLTNAGALTATGTIAATGLSGSLLSSATPIMNGTAAAGTSAIPARQDHVHASDTSRAAVGANSSITSLTGLTTALSETQGGTGKSTYTTGDILYASGTNTLSKLSATTNGYVLTLASGVPTWAASAGGGSGGITEDQAILATQIFG